MIIWEGGFNRPMQEVHWWGKGANERVEECGKVLCLGITAVLVGAQVQLYLDPVGYRTTYRWGFHLISH